MRESLETSVTKQQEQERAEAGTLGKKFDEYEKESNGQMYKRTHLREEYGAAERRAHAHARRRCDGRMQVWCK